MALQFCTYKRYEQIENSVLRFLSGLKNTADWYLPYIQYAVKAMGFERRGLTCCFCKKKCRSASGLYIHISKAHQYELRLLVRRIVKIMDIVSRFVKVRGSSGKRFKCRICNFECYRRIEIVEHILCCHDVLIKNNLDLIK